MLPERRLEHLPRARLRCGISRTPWDCWPSTSAPPASTWPSGVPTSISTVGRGRYVAAHLQASLPQPIWGWFAQADQFDMGPTFAPQPDIRRLLLGTPSILALAAADEGIAVTVEAGIEAIAGKARAITGFALELCDQLGLRSTTPRDPARRGGHVAVHHPNAKAIVDKLAGGAVITDFRDPDIVRIGCSPLTTRFTDVFDGLTALAKLV
jgi:kynureninase